MTGRPEDRTAVATALRRMADLIEGDETIVVPTGQSMTFWTDRIPGDPLANAVRIATALAPAGAWKAQEQHWGEHDFLELTALIAPGWKVDIEVPMAAAGVEAGQKTVTIWEPRPEIAALLGKPGEVQ